MSSRTLARRFRAETGTSPKDYRQAFNAKADVSAVTSANVGPATPSPRRG